MSATPSSERYTGRVKWFNNKAGYGFVTITDGTKAGIDVFVHHTTIKVDGELYKYLVQGEYVEFSLLSSSSDNHEFQAGDVSGIKGGKLMCETRRDLRTARQSYRTSKPSDDTVPSHQERPSRPPRAPRPTEPKSVPPPKTSSKRPLKK